MFLLALDTCDARGSIALLRDGQVVAVERHPADTEYSSWLLPATDTLLSDVKLSHADLEGYAVSAGPGSFTGIRVGLTTVKAWADVYGKPIFPVSRLAVLAEHAPRDFRFVGTFIDAQRNQLFGALYRRDAGTLTMVDEERVIGPAEFLRWADDVSDGGPISWVSLDPQALAETPMWQSRAGRGESIQQVHPPLAGLIGSYSLALPAAQRSVDALTLDANYVRRTDAEIFGKKAAGQ